MSTRGGAGRAPRASCQRYGPGVADVARWRNDSRRAGPRRHIYPPQAMLALARRRERTPRPRPAPIKNETVLKHIRAHAKVRSMKSRTSSKDDDAQPADPQECEVRGRKAAGGCALLHAASHPSRYNAARGRGPGRKAAKRCKSVVVAAVQRERFSGRSRAAPPLVGRWTSIPLPPMAGPQASARGAGQSGRRGARLREARGCGPIQGVAGVALPEPGASASAWGERAASSGTDTENALSVNSLLDSLPRLSRTLPASTHTLPDFSKLDGQTALYI